MIKNQRRSIQNLKKTGEQEDQVILSEDNIRLVMEENRSASDIELLDFKRAEEEINKLRGKLLDDPHTASEIHQLGNKRVLFHSLDKS